MYPLLLPVKITYTYWQQAQVMVLLCDWVCLVCICCRWSLCVDQLHKLKGLIHLSHASLGNAGSLIKDWIFHGGFGTPPATCSSSLSLLLPLTISPYPIFPLFPFITLFSLAPSRSFPTSPLSQSYYPSFIIFLHMPCPCLTVSDTFTFAPSVYSLLAWIRVCVCVCAYTVIPTNRKPWNWCCESTAHWWSVLN